MKQHLNGKRFALMASVITALSLTMLSARAQSTWINPAGGEWNDVLGWDSGVPNESLSGTIPAGNTVTYDLPMAAGNILGLTLGGSLTLNTNGFNIDPLGLTPLRLTAGAGMTISSSGFVTITNAGVAFRMMDRNTTLAVRGGTLLFQNNLGAITIGENGNVTPAAQITNDLGSITVDQSFQLRGISTGFYMLGGTLDLLAGGGIYESSIDHNRRFYIGGGTANLGNFLLARTLNGAAQAGLVISNGVVNFTSLRVGTANAASGATVAGGIVTNTGPFLINDRSNGATSGNRRIHFYQLGGSIYSTDAAGIIVANQSNGNFGTADIIGGFLDLRGGLLLAEGITLVKDATLINAHATLDLSGGEIYLGSVGLKGNVGVSGTSYTMNLNGGTLGAQADFAIVGDGTLGGDFTVKAADQAGLAHNITHNGVWSGAGSLTKTGLGTLTLSGINTFSGNTTIAEGKLALGVGGALSNSTRIEVAEGAMLDVSANGAYALNSGQTLAGNGSVSGSITAQSGSTISPGVSAGELAFANDLTIQGGTAFSFELSAATNDVVSVAGTLGISGGTSTVLINSLGEAIPPGTYTLFKYGTLNGSVANLVVAGSVSGTIQDNPGTKTISLTTAGIRGATNLVWVGDSVLNVWDVGGSSNWVNNATSFDFLAGDDVTFDNTGSTNPPVNLVGALAPNSVTVDATVDYTFEGTGKITGLTGLTKTHSGTLTMLAQNDYVGVTTIAGGTLSVSNLTDGGFASPIGAAAADATNLVLNGGTLQYLGTNLTWNRGLTLGSAGGGLSVADANTALITTAAATGEGRLIKKGAGRLDVRAINNHTGGTEIQAGTLRLDLASGATLGSGNLSLNGGATEAVFQFGGDQQTLANTLSITGTNNAINISGNNTFRDLIGDGTVYLRGTVNTLTSQGDMSTFSGRLVADGINNLRFYGSTGSSNAVFDLGSGSCVLNNRNGNVTINLGALLGGPSTSLRGASAVNNPSTYLIGALGMDTLFEGTISESTLERKASIVKVGSGMLTLSGYSTYTGDTTISQGTLALTGSAGLGSTPNITVAAGATLDVSGLFTPTLFLTVGQTLSGNGTVNGSIDTSSGGTVAPGTSLGTLTVTNLAALYGTTVMEINRGAVPNADKVVAATIQLGGVLNIQNIGFNLQPGDTFDLFDAATINNLGVTVQGPPGVVFDTMQLAVDGTITVTTVPAPAQITGTVLQAGNQLVSSGAGGNAFGTYRVLSSTDVAAPLATWSPVLTNLFEFDGSFSFTNMVDPAKPSEYFILQGQ